MRRVLHEGQIPRPLQQASQLQMPLSVSKLWHLMQAGG
jgi:hypothetical protein